MAVGARGELAAGAKLELLDRGELAFDRWLERLRDLGRGRGGSGYRSVGIERDELAQILENASAPPARRIAAAVALSAADKPEVKLRVRAIIDACANDDLRVAMERAAEGELAEEELARVVGETR
jgi:hypothetical protein